MFVTNGTAVITSAYRNLYEAAAEALERAVKNVSFSDFQSAVISGIASAEAYINHQAEKWNQKNPNEQLVDSRVRKISFDGKIDLWIPKMTNGRNLDKGFKNWSDFKRLRGLRDNVTVHAKQSSFTRTVYEIADGISIFRTGIAGLLIQLHELFDEKIPSIIIRGFFAPDIEVVETGL